MIGKIIPKISSGNNKLMLSETISFSPDSGLTITIPGATTGSEITLNFIFRNQENEPAAVQPQLTSPHTMTYTLTNFNSQLGVGTTTPLSFQLGFTSYFMFLFVHTLGSNESSINTMTISIYSNGP